MVVGFFESLPSFVKTLPETKQLDYVLNQLKWMETNFEDKESHHRLRKAAMETVLRYSVESSPFYNDERLLHVFCIVGKLSRTMGMKLVMEELHNRKQFHELAEFYVKWGEIFAEEKNRERFNEVWNEAIKANAKPISRVDEAFRAMLYQYFEMDDEMTVNLFRKPDLSKDLRTLGTIETAFMEQKAPESSQRSTKLTHDSAVKTHLKIADEQQSIEEMFAEAGNYAIHPDILQRRSSRMSISKLSAISEERSGCASGSLMNPSHNVELTKSAQPSAGDNPFLLTCTVAAENDNDIDTDVLVDKPSECPQSSHLTLHGTSFTEKFLSKAMRDFSSTVPVPPPRSVHHETDETTVLQEATLNESEQTHLPPASKKTKFEVYVEEAQPIKQTAPFAVYSDENVIPSSDVLKKRLSMERDLDCQKNADIHDDDIYRSQSAFRKPAITTHFRRSSFFGKAKTTSLEHDDETSIEQKRKYEGIKPSLPDRNDEETLAGLNKMAKTGAVTSTPASNFAPPIEDPIEESFRPLPSNEADPFFQKPAFDEAITANTAFGRRMSMSEQRRDNLIKLSQKIGVENIVGCKKVGLGVNSNINEELRRLSIAANDEDSNEILHEGLKLHADSEVNPWDEKLRDKIMTNQCFCPANVHEFPERCNRLSPGTAMVLGGERFDIECLIGEGGFAKVYKSKSEDGNFYAIKFEMPPCKWEIYACETLRIRIPKAMLGGVMNIRDAYLFSNASAIVYEYHKHGNLLDMMNKLQAKNMSCSGLLTVYLAWQISRILEAVHNAQIIHGDVKPDNFMILHRLNEDAALEQILEKKSFTLKLIDWGRAIDMNSLKGCTFRGKAGTVAFDCSEMQDGRPWTYQTDFYGFVSTLHVIIYGKYMKTYRNTAGRYSATSVMKRRWPQRELLEDIFDMCLNILDCESVPKWSTIIDGLENNIRYWITEDRKLWKQAARELNAGITP
ncbi:Protein kinase domain containing protein [Brugia malayi]|uniref:BMA-BUB-1, isoform b n=2 Tax=Brugia malayi TaxID=6279 RepID=A0A0J9Y6M5_BRUMA|nr:Protein kinase domain containing protein [Brugia malayi]CDQ03003.1 BMA-BUB-1, isoform b [Brugia malayi]VIO92403.1 Protein kinase domain containing protein [Brugia malayi]